MNTDGTFAAIVAASFLLFLSAIVAFFGTRLFWMQPYTVGGSQGVEWGEPVGEGWNDPGEEEMILDGAFGPAKVAATV